MELKNIKIKSEKPSGDWKNLREEFPTDMEAQYLVRADKDGLRRYFICELTEHVWDCRKVLRGSSFDHFDFYYTEPDETAQQIDLIPNHEIPDCFWMVLE